MLDAVLIQPRTGVDVKGVSLNMPSSVLYAASIARSQGKKLRIVDQRIDKNWRASLDDALDENPALVGITSMTGIQLGWGVEAARAAREKRPGLPIVWGGVHPTLLPEETARDPHVDVCVIGEGEAALPALIDAARDGKPFDSVPGVVFKKDGEIRRTESPELLDVNALPDPPFDLIDPRKYYVHTFMGKRGLDMVTSRGCPHRCGYCYIVAFHNRNWRAQNPEIVVRNVKRLMRYDIEAILFIDDNFFVNPNRVRAVCELLLSENINLHYFSNCRVEYLARYDLEFLEMIERCGFGEIFVGLETGSADVLERIKKDSTLEHVRIANEKLARTGIRPIYSFMAGLPDEGPDDLKRTIDLVFDLLRENPKSILTRIKLFTPIPGTELFDLCREKGFTPPTELKDWRQYDMYVSNLEWLSPAEKRRLECISLLSFFLDESTVVGHFGKNVALRFLLVLYSRLVKWRFKRMFFRFSPDVNALKYVLGKVG